MKKIIYVIFFVLLTLSAFATKPMPDFYPGGTNQYVTTADQYYQVFFDEEGEAFVAAEFSIYNADTEPITELNVEVPGTQLLLLNAMQQTQSCLEWDRSCRQYGTSQTCVEYDYYGKCLRYDSPCLDWDQVCSRYDSYQSYNKISVQPIPLSNSYSIPLILLSEIEENQRSSVILVYKVEGYSSNSLGAKRFEFETAKLPLMSTNVRVSVNVQDELYLQGGQSQVNYLSGFSKVASAGMMESSDMRMISNSIRYNGGLVKSASYLDPHESFSVKGLYSRSWLRVNMWKVIGSIALFAVILLGIFFGIKKIAKFFKEDRSKKEAKPGAIVPFMAGLMTAFSVTILWTVTILLIGVFNYMMGYDTSLLSLVLVILSSMLTLMLIIGVPIYVGTKYGAVSGFFTMISLLGWAFIFIVIIFLGIALLSYRNIGVYY